MIPPTAVSNRTAVTAARRMAARPTRTVLDRVLAHVIDDEVVALTRRLVRIPSVFRPGDRDGNERAVAHAVAGWCRDEGLAVEVHEVAPGRPNVTACLDGEAGGPTLCFEGHTDVVTEGDPGAWRHGPWSGVVEDGRPVDATGGLPDGREFTGVDGLERALLERPELFVGTVTEKLLTFALGRGIEPGDAPAVRKIVREAKADGDRLSALIQGIVASVPFQMRSAE